MRRYQAQILASHSHGAIRLREAHDGAYGRSLTDAVTSDERWPVGTVVVLPAQVRPMRPAVAPASSEKLTLRKTGASAIATLTFSKLSIDVISRSPAHGPWDRPKPPPVCRASGSSRRSRPRRDERSVRPCPYRARRTPK